MFKISEDDSTKIEDKIMTILQGIGEIDGCCNIISSALNNEYEPPTHKDIDNLVCILKEYVLKIKEEVQNYIDYCEESGIFNNSLSDKSNA